ncbi:MAG TPA: YihA family ribosome biogenesis GTP-binding protein [Leucothrix mucor]|uniref:Probable GTP-binding protein EngB n=1 Tax=Leucothrix mucor TaxID=45248 RepID=A0A7V2SYM4_LEUMU|nr:YihA family ribosome biogenesis GTP-binding protein [Leucothrix mucor]
MSAYYQQAHFIQSATTQSTLPAELGFEVAFAGRSNAGKSSSLNRLCQQKALARVSKTPGRTQLINFFALPQGRYLVDLPGYGYAKVPEKVKKKWQAFIESYLSTRFTLRGLVLIMDIRRPMQDYDKVMLSWAQSRNLAIHILLNKSDKFKRGKATASLLKARKELKQYTNPVSIQMFSAFKGDGVDLLRDKLDEWLYPEET